MTLDLAGLWLFSLLRIRKTSPSVGRQQLALAQGELVSRPVRSGEIIRAESGTTWVTLEADGQDYVLRPGQTIRVQTPGRAVFQDMRAGSLVHIVR